MSLISPTSTASTTPEWVSIVLVVDGIGHLDSEQPTSCTGDTYVCDQSASHWDRTGHLWHVAGCRRLVASDARFVSDCVLFWCLPDGFVFAGSFVSI